MLKYMLDGGPLMWVLLGLSVVYVAVIIDRLRVFSAAGGDAAEMPERALALFSEGKVADAIALCREKKGPVAAVLLVGLDRYQKLLKIGRNKGEIETSVSNSMSDYAPRVISALEKRINLLLTVGSVAPLVGMTGTVTGMIRAFGGMAGAGGSLQGSIVAGGIAEALITTAAGLLIAVPAVIFYNIFSNKVDQFTLKIEEAATELVDAIHLGPEFCARRAQN